MHVQQMLGVTVPVTSEEDTMRHTFGIDIRMMHLSAKDIFSVWDFAGQVLYFIHIIMYTSMHTIAATRRCTLYPCRCSLMCVCVLQCTVFPRSDAHLRIVAPSISSPTHARTERNSSPPSIRGPFSGMRTTASSSGG